MLPAEVWLKIIGYMPHPSIGELLTLARVEKSARTAVSFDQVWARFDAYEVRGQHNVCEYGGHVYYGIIAHFLQHLAQASDEVKWALLSRRLLTARTTDFNVSRYLQINALWQIIYNDYVPHFKLCLRAVELRVWLQWSAQTMELAPRERARFTDEVRPHVFLGKQVLVALIKTTRPRFLIYRSGDRDVDAAIAAHLSDREVNPAIYAHLDPEDLLYFRCLRPLESPDPLVDREFVLDALSAAENGAPALGKRQRVRLICRRFMGDVEIKRRALSLCPDLLLEL